MDVWKMQALGNDFLLVDTAPPDEHDWAGLAEQLCSRHYGVGSDGLLYVAREPSGDLRYRMWNPDGTEDFCVNGLRCAARFVYDRKIVTTATFSVQAIRQRCEIAIVEGKNGQPPSIQVQLGPPTLDPELVPIKLDKPYSPVLDYPLEVLEKTFSINSVSTGVTHTVIFVDSEVSEQDFLRFSPAIEVDPHFPERTCVLWTKVESPEHLRIRIWERGVGETLGCGSGACAAAVVARLANRTDDSVRVESRGGSVEVHYVPGGDVRLTGSAEYVWEGDLKLAGATNKKP
jgi:diaminopimelate epimerase